MIYLNLKSKGLEFVDIKEGGIYFACPMERKDSIPNSLFPHLDLGWPDSDQPNVLPDTGT